MRRIGLKTKTVYLLMFLLLILTLLLWFFTKAFATLHSSGSLMMMPSQDNVYDGINSEELKGIKMFLPTGATLIAPYSDTDSNIIKVDFNNDKQDELLYCYTNYNDNNTIGLTVLYCEKGIWYSALQINKNLLDLDLIKLCDVNADNNPELLIGWKESNSNWNGLDIYSWKDNGLKNLYSTAYSKLEVDGKRSDEIFGDRDRLIIWKEVNSYYYEDIIAWYNVNFVSVSDLYPEDFMDLVKYYKETETEYYDQGMYWYARANALMSAGLYSEAEDSINRAINLTVNITDIRLFKIIKGNCQALLSVSEDAEASLLDVIDEISKEKDINTKNMLLIDAYYYLGRYYYNIRDFKNAFTYFDRSSECCEMVYADNLELLKLKEYKIVTARTEAAAYAFSKKIIPPMY